MKQILLLILVTSLNFYTLQGFAEEHSQLKAFPEAQKGMSRFVIVLPHKSRSEEIHFKVEMIPGKNILTDGINKVRLDARIKKQPLKGWGYSYYDIVGSSHTMSTLMAAPEGNKPVNTWVTGQAMTIQYNSRLPIVIYAPEGYEVAYRIWSTSEATTKAKKG